ncbi:Putative AAA+ ATPase domain, ABC transporter type 1, transmembrane domain-containing protein [Colletotrichum destructivum]|uniref:AAA+ ATPase domain, ABC transporter type 1, transmembrane domain-containing protein n=1 Tax=Colletotrichum destructivum TaxID=34406 RepID=A0AAX4IXS5_9PEZI|nr:Putative AAA+ ATPase domain, ABC transporter type 1, transmembrane domain-containing protein [Colletotrichum destructivum]
MGYHLPRMRSMFHSVCPLGVDNDLGPLVRPPCRNGNDFTLVFEDLALTIVPSAILTLATLYRTPYLLRQSRKTQSISTTVIYQYVKILAICTLAFFQAVHLLQWISLDNEPSYLSLSASLSAVTATTCLCFLSYLEHDRSIAPSPVVTLYLLGSGLCDIPILRTLWVRQDNVFVPLARAAALLAKAIVFLLESTSKRDYLEVPYSQTSPEALGGIVNRSLFLWLTPTIQRGYRVSLEVDHLPCLDPKLSVARQQTRLAQVWKDWRPPRSGHSLLFATFSCFRWQFLAIVPARVVLIACKFSQPLLINAAVKLLSRDDGIDKRDAGVLLTGAAALIYAGIAFSTAAYKHMIYRTMLVFRSGLIGVIHESSLLLDLATAKDTAAVTLMSTDVDRIMAGIEMLDVIWATPIEASLAIIMLGRELGWACFPPLVVSIACAIGSVYLGKLATKYQKIWIESIQERVADTTHLLNNIKSIKMMGMTAPLAENIQKKRQREIDHSRAYRKVDTAQQALGNATLVLTPVLTFLLYYFLIHQRGGESLDPAKAFTSLSLIVLLSYPIVYFVFAVPRFIGSIGCYDRIQTYILSQDRDVQWSEEDEETESEFGTPFSNECEQVELESLLPKGTFIKSSKLGWMEVGGVTSPVFAADHTAGELVRIEDADFAFSADSSSVLHNISLTVRQGKYLLVSGPTGSGKSSLLLSVLGELRQCRGSTFRKPSLDIAFCTQEPWLPNLSVRDVITGPSTFDNTWLSEVIAACDLGRDISQLSQRENTLVGSNGSRLSGGQKQRVSLARALYSRKKILLLDDVLSGLDLSTERAVAHNVLGPNGLCRRLGITVMMAAPNTKYAAYFDSTFVLELGNLSENSLNNPSLTVEHDLNKEKDPAEETEHESRPSGDGRVVGAVEATPPTTQTSSGTGLPLYKYYFSTMGWGSTFLVFASSATFVFCFKFPDLWLKWWTESESRQQETNTTLYMTVYVLLAAVALIVLVSFSWSLKLVAVPRAAARLHQDLLSTTIAAPYYFLVAAGSGSIVNRFSEDLAIVDLQLTLALAKSIDGFFTIVAEASLIAYASALTALSFPPLLGVLYLLQKVYLRTSRRIRTLEIEARSPLLSHFIETLAGLATIRAFGWQRYWVKRQRDALDRSQRALYMTYCLQRWLNLVLDLVVAGVGVTVMALVTQLPSWTTDGGALGVSLTNIVTFSATLTYVIQGWAQLETSMGAIQRIQDFTNQTLSENKPAENRELPPGWGLTHASVRFDGVKSAYSDCSDIILDGVTFHITPGQKVGVCGRTGSGKSTMLLTLLRLAEVLDGRITIDNVDIALSRRDHIRSSVTVMPQDPTVFPGSIRYNLDPQRRHSDAEIKKELDRVGLSHILSSPRGLDATMTQSTSVSLSRGELQLFALARAVLRRHEGALLLVMDEVTSSVDSVAEEVIMRVVMESFSMHTVIAVVHRLNTIIDFDLVFVMDQGRLVESGQPRALLESPGSMFRRLYRH